MAENRLVKHDTGNGQSYYENTVTESVTEPERKDGRLKQKLMAIGHLKLQWG